MRKILFPLIFILLLCSMAAPEETTLSPAGGIVPIIPIFFGLVLLVLLIFIEIKIGKAIGSKLSKENGLILGIILIVLGVTLFIGIPIIINSNKKALMDLKKCPFCANEIKKEAIVCQFCNRDLP